MKTLEELNELKADWVDQGYFNIEETEGFEEHYDELLAFRLKIEKEQDEAKAEQMGLPVDSKLFQYLKKQDDEIKELEIKIFKLEIDLMFKA